MREQRRPHDAAFRLISAKTFTNSRVRKGSSISAGLPPGGAEQGRARVAGKRAAAAVCGVLLAACGAFSARAQAPAWKNAALSAGNPDAAVQVSLSDAIARAKKLSPELESALMNVKIAAASVTQARSANLPNVLGISQYIYTEGNGLPATRFIANNGVHEYVAQANVHQAISGALLVEYRRSVVEAAAARDQAAIAERGLLVTVVENYASAVAAEHKLATAEGTLEAARNFLSITQKQQHEGDAAHADVVKAQLQEEDSEAAVEDARQAREQARMALALMIFRNVNRPYTLSDDPGAMLTLPTMAAAQAAAAANPQLDAAVRTASAAHKALSAAWMGYLPSLSFDYYYGIDANEFATHGNMSAGIREPAGQTVQNLGYSATASLNMPLFTWGATHSKVKSAEALNEEAQMELSYTRRQVAGDLEMFYSQAETAQHDVAIRQQAVKNALESRRLTLLRYKAGLATALEVVNAESTVDTENAAWYDAKTQYATALANLATLTGVLR